METRLKLACGLAVLLIGMGAAVAHADTSVCPYTWNRNLKIGSTGSDVLALQEFLNSDPATAVAQSGAGSKGNETSRYGGLTAQAVDAFQEKYATQILTPLGLTRATGSVGTLTRARLNALCAAPLADNATSTTAAAPATNNVLIVGTTTQPTATVAPANAGGIPFTAFTLTAGSSDVTVNSITVQRVGPGEDGTFADVTLADQNGTAIGTTEYFNSNHQAIFHGPYVVPAGTTVTLTVSGDMASDETSFAGEMPALEVDTVQASAPVAGTLPIRGTEQTINGTLQIGSATATLSPYDPDGATTHYIGDTGVRFSGIQLTASSVEDLTLSSITWDQTGTAGSSDISDIATIVNGTAYPAATSDGRSYTSTFSPGIVIPRGNTIDLYVQGNLGTTGANRTVEFDIDNSSDIGLTGNAYGFGVGVAPGDDTAQSGNSVFLTSDGTTAGSQGSSFFAGSVATISPGAVLYIGNAQ
jgi:hypothetical protein